MYGSLNHCLSVDLEINKDGSIGSFGAIRSDTGQQYLFSGGDLDTALAALDQLAQGAEFLLGHNLISFDIPHLVAVKPHLQLLRLRAVDTLRLSPLAFPRNPYHRLVKHYQDGQLTRGRINDPALDAKLALNVFKEQQAALRDAPPDLLTAWHWLITQESDGKGFDGFWACIRREPRPSRAEAVAAIRRRLSGASCVRQGITLLDQPALPGWPLAYALAWLSVAGGNSVMPPWVNHQYPNAGEIVRRLRDTPCDDPTCNWCRARHDARKELERWLGFRNFRPEPKDDRNRSMQEAIVEAAMTGEHALGILPTGTGKSLCYQIPALSRYDKTGALTLVISPLVALMTDQVAGLEARGIGACTTINSLLSMPERADALDRVRLGDAGILIISPEQLRSRSLGRALEQREIGAWVLDEAHCLSRWGHDFRPDYRYVGRFIKKKAGDGPAPPILCLTATAKPEVKEDILQHFLDHLDIRLKVFDGGTERSNLTFEVVPTAPPTKFSDIHHVLTTHLPQDRPGGAIVYCATRRRSEEVAEFLQLQGVAAEHYHAGLRPETRKEVQQRFIGGELRAIAATNAFGMGIDKPDIRLVIHADIPGSLENYLQEAGRAGRDRAEAGCVLLYDTSDVERQFGLLARSRLTRAEIHSILRALRKLNRKSKAKPNPDHLQPPEAEIVATAGEVLNEDEDRAFLRDSTTDDTRVRTAVAWLEEAQLLTREENVVHIFPSSLRVGSMEEARTRLAKASIKESYRQQLLSITGRLIEANADEGVTTDELMLASRLSPAGVRAALYDLEKLNIANNDTVLTAFVHTGVSQASAKRFDLAAGMEAGLIAHLRETAPDLGKGDTSFLHLRIASQALRDTGLVDPLPERLWRILRSIAYDGRGEDGATGSMTLRKQDAETVRVTLQREWQALEDTAKLRRDAAKLLLNHLLGCLPAGSRGKDLLAETTFGKLNSAIVSDILVKSRVKNPAKLMDRALLWLHEQEVIRLNKGLTVFRPAMTIRLVEQEGRGFGKADFQPLAFHYQGQILQVHIMEEFARLGLGAITDALRLAMDYFASSQADFLQRWLPDQKKELGRQTRPESWQTIVESLKNRVQQNIVADEREATNVLVLAGPGAGKTRILVHRIAYLVRVRRQDPRGILALTYNRHAAVEVRRRLADLIGRDARGLVVLTCHALAMRLVGASFKGQMERPDSKAFRNLLRDAAALLRGEGLEQDEADTQRERLLAGFRWILVDEYQDMAEDHYQLISALAGRTLDQGKLNLFVVGDDDQNIYAFNGASVEFIRRFEEDYHARPVYLTENYRSTGHIIDAANTVIQPARERMKAGHPIRVNRKRSKDPPGGQWQQLDPISRGRVQILPAEPDPVSQARVAIAELRRLAGLTPEWDWSRCAVIARKWRFLEPAQACCKIEGVPVQFGNEEIPNFWRLRETRNLCDWLHRREGGVVTEAALRAWLEEQAPGRRVELLRQALDEHSLEFGGLGGHEPDGMDDPSHEPGETTIQVEHFIEWLAEWGREVRRRQRGLLLVTAHRAKGLEFDHLVILDGDWSERGNGEDPDAPRRLYYVAMTRAKLTLTLICFRASPGPTGGDVKEGASRRYLPGSSSFPASLPGSPAVLTREAVALPPASPEASLCYRRLGLEDVDLGFPGRYAASHQVHRAIAAISPGDPLKLIRVEGRYRLLDRNGTLVGRLARKYQPPAGMQYRSATVSAIVAWRRQDSKESYGNSIRCNAWEVVLPELVFQAEHGYPEQASREIPPA